MRAGTNDPVQSSPLCMHKFGIQHSPTRRVIGSVGFESNNLAASLLDFSDGVNNGGVPVVYPVLWRVFVRIDAGRQWPTSSQQQPRGRGGREPFCELQPDATQPAGDQVGAVGRERQSRGFSRRQVLAVRVLTNSLLDLPAALPTSRWSTTSQPPYQRLRGGLGVDNSLSNIEVDTSHPKPWDFGRQYEHRANYRCRRRISYRRIRYARGTGRRDYDLDWYSRRRGRDLLREGDRGAIRRFGGSAVGRLDCWHVPAHDGAGNPVVRVRQSPNECGDVIRSSTPYLVS